MSGIIGILLAAGASRRFGADKLTQTLADGTPLAVQACRNLQTGTDGVLAVLRPGADTLAEWLRAEGAEVCFCAAADAGMGVSLASGIRAQMEAQGWLVALADMPWIAPTTICQVANALREGTAIAAPVWQGQRGHPVGFARQFGAELAQLDGDSGAKSLLQRHRHQIRLIDCDDPGILRDIDFPADLQHSP